MLQIPQISFVIIEYHSVQDVSECAISIISTCENINTEIIASSNSEYPAAKQAELVNEFPNINWVFNKKNGGFANGMNSGLKQCSGEIIAIMNPDVRIHNRGVNKAIDFIKKNNQVGLIGPKIIDEKGLIQDTCRPFMTPLHFLRRIPARIFKSKNVLLEKHFDYSKSQPVDWVIGAFMMIKRSAFSQVGGLDNQYFLYVEDMDWCMRFWKKGYQIIYYPALEVKYKGDRKSTSIITERKFINRYIYYHFKSYIRFLLKFGLCPKRPTKIE